MKKLCLSLLLTAIVAVAVAAVGPIVTDTLMRIQCDPASGVATSFFEKKTTIDGQTFTQPWESVSWPIGSTKTVTYTYNGQSFTQPYAQVLAAVQAIAQQERNSP
jgi:hypothetical protein